MSDGQASLLVAIFLAGGRWGRERTTGPRHRSPCLPAPVSLPASDASPVLQRAPLKPGQAPLSAASSAATWATPPRSAFRSADASLWLRWLGWARRLLAALLLGCWTRPAAGLISADRPLSNATPCQVSVAGGIPFALLLFKGLPQGGASAPSVPLYASVLLAFALLKAWPAPAFNNPAFAGESGVGCCRRGAWAVGDSGGRHTQRSPSPVPSPDASPQRLCPPGSAAWCTRLIAASRVSAGRPAGLHGRRG